MATLGIDIGGSSVKAAAVHDGQTLWTGRSDSYSLPTPGQLAAAIRQAVGGRAWDGSAVGLCVPGLLDERKECIALATNLPALQGVRLVDVLNEALGRAGRLVLSNDANATAWDLYTARRLAGRLLTVVIGTGVGASVVDAGGPLFVDGESPGHVGQMDVSLDDHPPLGPDEGAGSLEAYLGTAALARQYGPDPAGVLAQLRAEDPPLRALARAIRICHALYRPHHVIVAGGTGVRLKPLLSDIRRVVEKGLTNIVREGWTLDAGEHDFHAAVGAAKWAARHPN